MQGKLSRIERRLKNIENKQEEIIIVSVATALLAGIFFSETGVMPLTQNWIVNGITKTIDSGLSVIFIAIAAIAIIKLLLWALEYIPKIFP